ncbi:MAG: hypothetical protein LUM44_17700 [Pyrinomonadaceae bacterium]|nr:hypothetical protein [Pyrinomonadaceae bacterium]
MQIQFFGWFTETKMIHSLLNAKLFFFSSVYAGFCAFAFILQPVLNYTALLPHPTLAGLCMLMSAIGGILSYLWERKTNPRASLRTNIAFAWGLGIMVGLLTYDYFVVQRQMVNYWLGSFILMGFANQVIWGLLAVFVKKEGSRYLNIKEDGQTPAKKGKR